MKWIGAAFKKIMDSRFFYYQTFKKVSIPKGMGWEGW